LKEEHIMIINGVECVTLGHNFEEEVVKHPYFGSNLIVEDLKKIRGWESGLIQFASGCMIRDSKNGLVCGFQETVGQAAE
jgi:hypothetical protein